MCGRMMSASDEYIARYIAGVKTLVLGMYKALQWHATEDDRLSTCFANVAKCVELLWEYRVVDRSGFPELWFVKCEFGMVAQEKGEWFEKDLAGWAALIIIRDQVQPLLQTAKEDVGRFNAYVRGRLDGLNAYVVGVGRAIEPAQMEGGSS